MWWSGHLLWALLSSLRNAELEHDLFAAQCTISLAATLAIRWGTPHVHCKALQSHRYVKSWARGAGGGSVGEAVEML